MKNKKRNHAVGFTLVEMLVVIAIIGVLASILLPVIARAKTKAKVAATKVQMADIEQAITTYKIDYSRFPVPKDYPRNEFGDVTVGGGIFPYSNSGFGLVENQQNQSWGLYGGVVGKFSNKGRKSHCWDDEYEYGDQRIRAHLMRNNDVMTILLNENTDDWEKKKLRDSRTRPGGWAEASKQEPAEQDLLPDAGATGRYPGWWYSPRKINGEIEERMDRARGWQTKFRPSPARSNVMGQRSPKKNVYLDVKESDYSVLVETRQIPGYDPGELRAAEAWFFESDEYLPQVELPGISPTRIYRDPFGNEFVISMDLNGNGNCTDQFYSSSADRAAAAGMAKNKAGEFGLKGREAIIWTSGPDKYTSPLASGAGEENGDNIMSWK